MKKSIILTLALVFVLGIAGTAFAANPFVDVPAKHWAYDAVAKLAQAGIVDGYGDGTFKGDKTMTRYEMAQIVAKAMARADKANAEQKAAIDKLSVEFSTELNNMGVRVAKLEKKAAADSVNITGYARVKYENYNYNDYAAGSSPLSMRTRLFVNGQINDQWSYAGRLQADYDLRSSSTVDQGVKLNNAYVSGPIAGTNATFGRFDWTPNYGLMYDSTLNGAKFDFGNVLKATVVAGKQYDNDKALSKDDTMYAVQLQYAASKATNIVAGYYNAKNGVNASHYNVTDKNTASAWELGFDTKFAQDWKFKANYGRTNASNENTSWLAGVDYKGADKTKVGSWGAYGHYRNLKANGTLVTTFDNPFANGVATNGGKGYEIGFTYVPMNNAVFTTAYNDIKSTTSGSTAKSKYYVAKMEFWF